MISASILIDNSDNKLTQQEWSAFVAETGQTVEKFADTVHFFGGSTNFAPRQNVCWVADVPDASMGELRSALAAARRARDQCSVALLSGRTDFV